LVYFDQTTKKSTVLVFSLNLAEPGDSQSQIHWFKETTINY